jgi:transcriptional regulator of arginine metabolism
MNKSYRQAQIVQLIKRRQIHTQERLAQELQALGIETTQVTLSRDIRELGLVKRHDGYAHVEGPANTAPDVASVAADTLTDVRAAQNLVVLKTRPGHANVLAVALDQTDWPEVVGTVAGDDTILVVTPDSGTASTLQKKMLEFLE